MSKRTVTAHIVGMRYHPVNFDVREKVITEEIELCPEPDNPHDEYAVAVYVLGCHIGYIDKQSAKWVSPLIQEGNVYDIAAVDSNSASAIKIKITVEVDDINTPKPISLYTTRSSSRCLLT